MAGNVTNPLEIVIEPETPQDRERLQLAAEMLAAVDSYVDVAVGPQGGQIVLMGPMNHISSSRSVACGETWASA